MSKNPADRLIVALDVPVADAFDLVRRLRYQARWYKLRLRPFVEGKGRDLARYIIQGGNFLMIDAKLYDTRDSVRGDMEEFAALGASMVTVHASCVQYATGWMPKVLAVSRLTDTGGVKPFPRSAKDAYGVVCPPLTARWHREDLGTGKIIVCPGIRPIGAKPNNHVGATSPGDAIRNGADFIVVGRPIYAAADPVTATRAITREIESAQARAGCPARDEGARP